MASRSWLIIFIEDVCTECPSNFAVCGWGESFFQCVPSYTFVKSMHQKLYFHLKMANINNNNTQSIGCYFATSSLYTHVYMHTIQVTVKASTTVTQPHINTHTFVRTHTGIIGEQRRFVFTPTFMDVSIVEIRQLHDISVGFLI